MSQRLAIIALIAIGLVGSLPHSGKAETVRVVFPYVPSFIESPDEGLIIEVYKAVAQHSGQDIEIEVLPVRRALKDFAQGSFDVFGAFPSLAPVPPSLASVPYVLRANVVFYKPAKFYASVEDLSDLAGRRVGLSAYLYPAFITDHPDIEYERVPDDLTLFRMLASNRIDAAIIGRVGGMRMRTQLGLENVIANSSVAISSENIFALFAANRSGIVNHQKFNQAIYDMLCNGTLAAILRDPELVPDVSIVERDIPPAERSESCEPQRISLIP
ncbi:amino acid ABC transporter substrate-binding protein [Thalassospira sp. HF15]|uniref:substrate-binding periplasmic protein n=1 Tax=Thalassospira sp. HF15 TaxID=2722755 RepID=UPI00142FD6AC|nr:transporter substrate-binding domain-containing protein [Thalassospira sp. HF15]NIY76894.1 amino acid ABC transporter substrate-binding protein [Thalassospira sp. HF15]